MIFKIAYRNIWRNKLRSLIVILAITLGIWGSLFVISLAKGLTAMRHRNAVATAIAHIQIHHPDYNKGIYEKSIHREEQILELLRSDPMVRGISSRIKSEAFLESTGGSGVLIINGIDPVNEVNVSSISKMLSSGNYFRKKGNKAPVLIGKALADKLSLKTGSVLRLTLSTSDGGTITSAFGICGIYQSGNSMYDGLNAFVLKSNLSELTGTSLPNEIAVMMREEEVVDRIESKLESAFPGLSIESWKDLAPELGYADKMMTGAMTLFLSIIMAALAFGIVNTMLMAVLERRKELGMLLAVGMNKKLVFRMIMTETLVLTLLGAPFGVGFALITQKILGNTGIDLSYMDKGLASVGLQSTIYPEMELNFLLILSGLTILTGILSAIYPARKALSLQPAVILRNIA